MKLTKNQLKELVKEAILERISEEDKLKVVQKKDSEGPKKATTDIQDNPFGDEEKKEKKDESVSRRFTVKEVQKWMKTLEENRYKKVYNADARRVAWMVNNEGVDLQEMPKSMSKKWTKAQYGRERYLAKEFVKSKTEQMNEAVWKLPKGFKASDVDELDAELYRAGLRGAKPDFNKGTITWHDKPGRVGGLSRIKKILKKHKAKLIKETSSSEQKLRHLIREILKEQLNEVKFKKIILPNDMKTKVKVSKMIKQLKLKIDKDYDVRALDSVGKKQEISVLPKHYNKFLELLVSNNIKVRG